MNDFNRITNTRHGNMLYNHNDRYVGKAIEFYGEFSELEWELMADYIDADSVAIDAGANHGALTIPMAKKAIDGYVVAVEPQPYFFQALCANIAINSLTNVKPMQVGLGAEPGLAAMNVIDPTVPGNFGGLPLGEGTYKTQIVSIDSLPLRKVDFIKMDIEGMECDALDGARETIQKFQPVIYMEIDKNTERLTEKVMEMGYTFYAHTPPLFNPNNWNNQAENLWPNVKSINAICIPLRMADHVPEMNPLSVPSYHPE